MAITAKFQADFSSFQDAVEKADVALADFAKGAGRAEQSLNRMVDNFSGRKLIQDATLMTRAIEEMGGTSKLTAKELESVGLKANEAVTKLKALGLEIPQGLQKIATETKGIGSSMTDMLGIAGKVAGAFGIAFSVGAVVNFGKQLFTAADTLTKLHDKTGLSTDALQRFQTAGDDAGNTVEELAKGVTAMQGRLAGGDQSAVAALGKLGLTLNDLRAKAPERQFMDIADAIRAVKDPADQVNFAMDVFGKSGAEILPTIKRGFDDLKDSAPGMSEAAIKALDDTGDAIDRLWSKTKATIGNVVGTALSGTDAQFSNLRIATNRIPREGQTGPITLTPEELAEINAPMAKYLANLDAVKLSETEVAAITKTLSSEYALLHDKTVANTKAGEDWKKITDELQSAGDGWRKTLLQIDGTIVESIKFYLDAGVAQNILADAYGVTVTQIKAVAAARAAENKEHEAMIERLNKAVTAEIEAQNRLSGAFAQQGSAIDQLNTAIAKLNAQNEFGLDITGQITELNNAFTKSLYEEAKAQDEAYFAMVKSNNETAKMPGLLAEATRALKEFALTGEGVPAVGQTVIGNRLERKDFGGNIGIPIAGGGGVGIPRFDSGGPTKQGLAFLHDDEYVVPKGGALVSGGGGMSVNITINGSVLGNKEEIARVVSDAILTRGRVR